MIKLPSKRNIQKNVRARRGWQLPSTYRVSLKRKRETKSASTKPEASANANKIVRTGTRSESVRPPLGPKAAMAANNALRKYLLLHSKYGDILSANRLQT